MTADWMDADLASRAPRETSFRKPGGFALRQCPSMLNFDYEYAWATTLTNGFMVWRQARAHTTHQDVCLHCPAWRKHLLPDRWWRLLWSTELVDDPAVRSLHAAEVGPSEEVDGTPEDDKSIEPEPSILGEEPEDPGGDQPPAGELEKMEGSIASSSPCSWTPFKAQFSAHGSGRTTA